jgi:hypothetical protein
VISIVLVGSCLSLQAAPPPEPSAQAVKELKSALGENPASFSELLTRDFVHVPLTRADADSARRLLWEAHTAIIRSTRAKEIKDRCLRDGKLEMPFDFRVFGEKPKSGRSLWISLHGGGNAPKRVNDRQWENQKKLYTIEEGIYLTPRAPTNTWNLWHEPHIDRLLARLIEDLILLEDVNPDRVYLLGYSAGGDGVYQLAPRMADRWAAAAMMAGHPNGVSLRSLRNVPFALQVGGNDSAYNRNKVGREYGEQLKKLQTDDPKGYHHFVKIHEGLGHWMNREDRAALPWMSKFTRNPVPERVVWKQAGTLHSQSYWLAVPPAEMKEGSLIDASWAGQSIQINEVEQVQRLTIRFDDRMSNLDIPIQVMYRGRILSTTQPSRTISTILRTMVGRGDLGLVFSSELNVTLPSTNQ